MSFVTWYCGYDNKVVFSFACENEIAMMNAEFQIVFSDDKL